ncbi:hypothetical protein ACHAXA_005137 [Cyclostephanos tholiformis]|uniref:Uncharacterized protein n=1 Tax=Cyclostephanos tholiformis TaxID=382380 RepID=A0ABD3RXC2_9STRA
MSRARSWAYALLAVLGAARLLLHSSPYGDVFAKMKMVVSDVVVGRNYNNIDGAKSSSSSYSYDEFRSYDRNYDKIVFRGAREWYEYWSYASSSSKNDYEMTRSSAEYDDDRETAPDVDASSSPSRHVHDDYVISVVESVTEEALNHVYDMKRRYESVGALPDFYSRGIGWIWDRLGMALTVVVTGDLVIIDEKDKPDVGASETTTLHLHSGPISIFVVDTIGRIECGSGVDDPDWMVVQPPLTMWIRACGSEIFAGIAMPHNLITSNLCAWRYDFHPTYDGVYSIHAKVLTYNGFVDMLANGCTTRDVPSRNDESFDGQVIRTGGTGASDEEQLVALLAMNAEFVRDVASMGNYTHHRGIRGFKFYGIEDACCTACARSRNCKMYSIPGALYFDECELYFDGIEDDVDFLDRDYGSFLGRERNYSYTRQDPLEFPSIRGRRGRGRRKLAISSDELNKVTWPVKMNPLQGFPPRRGANDTPGVEVSYFLGCGWSSLMSFESPCHYPSDDLVFGSGQKVNVVPNPKITADAPEYAVNELRSCLLVDERLDVSNGRWVRYPYPDASFCGSSEYDTNDGQFTIFRFRYFGDKDPICWHRDDLTQIANGCAEPGCKFVVNHRWMTDLKRDSKWFGWWKSYSCDYREMGDADIQRCIDLKNISKIETRGASLKNVVDSYMSQKLQNINMTTNTNNIVILDTLKMPHLLWHKSVNEHRNDLMNDFPNVTANGGGEYYFLSGFTFTSEREPHVQIDRSLQFSKMAYDILTPKGYKMINAFDVTAAFAFDTDGQV